MSGPSLSPYRAASVGGLSADDMSSAVAHALPPSILALFAPRAPLVYKPPISKNAPFSTKRPKLKCVALRLNSGPSTHTQPWNPCSLRWSSLERL